MKSEKEVRRRLHQVLWKYHKLRLSRELSYRPENCRYYALRKRKHGESVAFCVQADPRSLNLCHFEECPSKCSKFVFSKTREQIKEEFKRDLQNSLYKQHQMKDLAQLEWVLELDASGAGDMESHFVDSFLSYIERQHQKRQRLWYRSWVWFCSLFSYKREGNSE